VTDPVPTVGSRARAAGISDEAMQQHLEDGLVRLGGEVVTDLDQPAPVGSRWWLAGR
jgi:hypothetical protein